MCHGGDASDANILRGVNDGQVADAGHTQRHRPYNVHRTHEQGYTARDSSHQAVRYLIVGPHKGKMPNKVKKFCINLKFGRCPGSSAAEPPVKPQEGLVNLNTQPHSFKTPLDLSLRCLIT